MSDSLWRRFPQNSDDLALGQQLWAWSKQLSLGSGAGGRRWIALISDNADIHVLVGTGSVLLLPGAVCVFEEAQRYSFEGITMGSGVISVVVWPAQTSWSSWCHQWATDYIWDFMLHPSDGALETRVHATGNINTAFLSGGAKSLLFGNCVEGRVPGAVHAHSFHFKLDLDVAGEF